MHQVVSEKKDQIELVCRRNNVARLDVFGSAARVLDFETERSDIDFLVDFNTSGPDAFLILKEEFERLLQRPIDLVDRRALQASRNHLRRARILADAETVFLA